MFCALFEFAVRRGVVRSNDGDAEVMGAVTIAVPAFGAYWRKLDKWDMCSVNECAHRVSVKIDLEWAEAATCRSPERSGKVESPARDDAPR